MKLVPAILWCMVSMWAHVPAPSTLQRPSPAGDFLHRPPPPVSPATAREMEAKLAEARRKLTTNPHDPESIIWVGRRLGYLGRFVEAIQVYTEGANEFPRDPRFYRHRGHRYLTLRRFDLAIRDFERAAQLVKGKPDEIEPDGQPNARNIPTSTLQFNIWYHLGLAHYLKGNNEKALDSFRECLKVSKNPDSVVATSHWLYMTLRRLNRMNEAVKVLSPIKDKMDIIENDGYYRLLMMYKGQVSAESLEQEAASQGASPGSASILYGIGNWYHFNGRGQEARRVFRKLLDGNQWTSFGYIAAEAQMKIPGPSPRPK
jgi:tetratricopeptide (TPR) repeat protein